MAQFSVGVRTPIFAVNVAAPVMDIRSAATDRPRILEIFGFINNPTAINTVMGVGRPATPGTVKTNSLIILPYDTNTPAASVVVGTEWSVLPTVPAAFMRRTSTYKDDAPGNAFRFKFDSGISIGVSSSLVLWVISLGASPVFPIYFDINIELDV